MFKSFEELQSFGKDQVEAATAASSALTKSLQAIATETGDYSKKSLEAATAAFEKDRRLEVRRCRLPGAERIRQVGLCIFVAQSTKIGELYTALAKDAFKPVELAVAKVQAVAK